MRQKVEVNSGMVARSPGRIPHRTKNIVQSRIPYTRFPSISGHNLTNPIRHKTSSAMPIFIFDRVTEMVRYGTCVMNTYQWNQSAPKHHEGDIVIVAIFNLGMSSNRAAILLDSEALGRRRERRNQVIYAVSHLWIMISKQCTGCIWEPGLGTGLDLHVACSGRGGISWNRAETLVLY
jgi:hypothetical protein